MAYFSTLTRVPAPSTRQIEAISRQQHLLIIDYPSFLILLSYAIVAVGIDLETTTSSVAFSRTGNVKVIANEVGNRTTPSYGEYAIPTTSYLVCPFQANYTQSLLPTLGRLSGKQPKLRPAGIARTLFLMRSVFSAESMPTTLYRTIYKSILSRRLRGLCGTMRMTREGT